MSEVTPAAVETTPATEVPAASSETPAVVLGKDGKPFDPARAQATIEAQREELRVAKAAQTELEKLKAAQAEAEQKRLEDEGKFKEIADTRTAERDAAQAELKTATERLARANEILAADLDKRTEKWPPELLALVPTEGDALDRLEAIQKVQPAADAFLQQPASGGLRLAPVPAGAPKPNEDEARAAQARTTRRMFG